MQDFLSYLTFYQIAFFVATIAACYVTIMLWYTQEHLDAFIRVNGGSKIPHQRDLNKSKASKTKCSSSPYKKGCIKKKCLDCTCA